jgi:LysM repeat protein
MTVLSPYSSKFTDVLKESKDLFSQGGLQTKEERTQFIKSKGLDPDEFRKTYKEYEEIEAKGGAEDLAKPGLAAGRLVLGTVGKIGEGVQNIGEAFFPKTTEAISEKYYDIVPKSVERKRQELFAPTMTGLEKFVTTAGSIIVPGTQAVKGLSYAGKLANLGKASRLGTAAKYGVGFSIGATAVEKPEDNIVNVLAEYSNASVKNEQGKEIGTVGTLLNKLKVNPNDAASEKYLKAFIGNLAFEGVAGAAFGGLKGVAKTDAIKKLITQPTKEFASNVTKGVSKTADYVLPTAVKGIGKKIKRIYDEEFTSRMGLSDKAFKSLLLKEGRARDLVTEAEGLTVALKKATEKEGLNVKGKAGEPNLILLNNALGGDKVALENIKKQFPETANVLTSMRKKLDSFSEEIRDNVATSRFIKTNPKMTVQSLSKKYDVEPEELIRLNPGLTDDAIKAGNIERVELPSLKTTIDDNLGMYLNRTYRIFDDPSYAKNIPQKVQDDAVNYLKGLKDKKGNALLDEEEVGQMLYYLTKGLKNTDERKMFFNTIGKRGGKILSRRKDIPVQIRALWGEVKDPFKSYVNTFTKSGNLIAEHKFRTEIAEEALKQGKATRETVAGFSGKPVRGLDEVDEGISFTESTIGLGGTNTNINNPLKGLFLDPSWKKAIEQGTDVNINAGDGIFGKAVRGWMNLKATSQAAKTVYSIPTHGRNVIGNLFISLANGTVNPNNFRKAFKATADRYRGKMTPELREKIGYYQRLGIIDSSLDINSLRKAAGEGFKFGPDGLIGKAAEKSKLKFLNKKTVQLYEAEDNLFKINNFENLKQRYKKAFPDMSEDMLDKFTAQRTRDMMPNYNLVPKAFKRLRAMPVGNFVAFPAEMVRNTKNLFKYSLRDIGEGTAKEVRDLGYTGKIDEKQLKGIGYTRAAGITAAAVAGDGIVETSKAMFGVTDEQEEALNKIVAPWERGQNKVFTGPVTKNSKGQIEVDYMNLGPIDPYSYFKAPAKMLISAIINNKEYNDAEINDIFAASLGNIISPFASPSMVAQEFMDIYDQRKRIDGNSKLGSLVVGLGSTLTPGTVDFFLKRKKFYDAQEKLGEGREVNQYGFTIAPGEVDLPAFLGFRRQKLNLSQGLGYNTGEHIKNMRRSKSIFANKARDFSVDDPKEVFEAYKKSQKEKLKHNQRLRTTVKAYKALGMNEADMYKALIKDGALSPKVAQDEFEEIIFADKNIFRPDMIDESLIKFGKVGSKTPIPIDSIMKVYRVLQNNKID